MTKKDFGAALGRTNQAQKKVLKDRFAVADSVLLSGTAPKAVTKTAVVPPAVEPGVYVTRDTFSMPVGDYALIEQMRVQAAKEGCLINKSEIVRAALRGLAEQPTTRLVALLNGLEKVKPGRK